MGAKLLFDESEKEDINDQKEREEFSLAPLSNFSGTGLSESCEESVKEG